jgi:uncharacterized membrane protein YecN with MAPEG domain
MTAPDAIALQELTVFITPAYAGIFGITLVLLSWRVVRLRNKLQVKMGDGGHTELTAATRAQDNLLEYLPMALILMFMLEVMATSAVAIHALGLLFLLARFLHLLGIREPSGSSMKRKIGTRLTWLMLLAASALCIAAAFGCVI